MGFEKDIEELKNKMTPLNTTKYVVGTLISCGAMAAVLSMMKGSTVGIKGVTKILAKLGVFVLACKAGDIAENYFSHTVDEFVDAFRESKKEAQNESDAGK